MRQKGKLNLLILLILIGLGASVYLTVRHFQLLTQGVHSPSFCTLSETIDCDSVMMSRFSQWGPLPLGGLGWVYFLYLLLPAVYARWVSDQTKASLALPFLSTFPSLFLVFFLTYISGFVIKTWCILCIALYLVTLGVFFLLRSILQIPFSKIGLFVLNYFKEVMGKGKYLNFTPHFFGNLFYGLVIFSFSLFILYANQRKYAADFEDFDRKDFLTAHYRQTAVPLNPSGRPFWGNAKAPVTVVEFSDFECPFCKLAALTLKPLLKSRSNDVAFYFLNYPLDKSCNPSIDREMHEYACDAAKAALCAQDQGKFWPFHDLLFANQPRYNQGQLLQYAKKVGLDPQQLQVCMISEATANRLRSDIELGKASRLEFTPSIYINGRLLKEWNNPIMFNLVIDEEIKKSKSK